MRRRTLTLCCYLAVAAVPAMVPAMAAAEPAAPYPVASDWTLTLGVEGRVTPSYDGSDRSVLRPFPLIDIRRAGTPRRFSAVLDGASIGILEAGTFRLGPAVKVKLPRRESDDHDLRGLGDVGWVVEPGGFVEFWPLPWLRARAELRQGFGGHHGLVSDITADLVAKVTPQLTLSGGPRMTLASGPAMSPYFSITPTQSIASGLPVFDAGGGLRSLGAGAQARYEWTPQWAARFFVEYERLTGAAANSPLVIVRGTRDQITTGLGVSYSFDVGLGRW